MKMEKIPRDIKEQIVFCLEDDNEVMSSALSGDLDEENKQMNRELIKEHNKILDKLSEDKSLSKKDYELIRDANEIDVNDEDNFREHYEIGVKLDKWLDKKIK